jgi:transposase InsO family protein
MEDDIKPWTAKRSTALMLDLTQGKTTAAEASWAIADWIQFYKHRRAHQALGMKTPTEAYALAT